MINTEREFITAHLENSKAIAINTDRGLNLPELDSLLSQIDKAIKSLNQRGKISNKRKKHLIVCLISLLETSAEVYQNYPSYRSTELLLHIASGILSAGTLGKYYNESSILLNDILSRYTEIADIMNEWGIIYK